MTTIQSLFKRAEKARQLTPAIISLVSQHQKVGSDVKELKTRISSVSSDIAELKAWAAKINS